MAKVDARRIAAVLADPGPARLVLIFGEDGGLVRERGEALSRAVAGSARGAVVVSLPGSKAAVELALTRIVVPELRHLLRELRK